VGRRVLVVALLMGLAVVGGTSVGEASIIYHFDGVTTVSPGVFEWAYSAHLAADQKINSALGRNFGVLYDFQGLIPGTFTSVAVAPGITVSSVAEAVTSPQPVFQAVPDDAGVMNLVTNINGSFTPPGPGDVVLYRVIARSLLSLSALTLQSGQDVKNVPGDPSDNTLAGNSVRVPGPTGAVPEPTTLLLIGSGLLGIGVVQRRRSRRKASGA